MIYSKINDFCKVRNKGNCFSNGTEPTPRVKFIMDLLTSEGIPFELDIFEEEQRASRTTFGRYSRHFDKWLNSEEDTEPKKNCFFNIIMLGTSNKMIIAHHDVNNPNIDNANDNSASVINVIATKKLRPEVNAVLVDGEEFGGKGSNHLSKQIIAGDFGDIKWVLNYELTGKGGKYFFIGNYPGPLSDKIIELFNCPVVSTPYNDSVTIRRYGIDSVVINPLPPLPEGQTSDVLFPDGKYLNHRLLYNCHRASDNLASISTVDMKEFVEEVVLKIIDNG
jgi:Peptidase family M28